MYKPKVVRIGSKRWNGKFFILRDVIFLARLQGKFEIDRWKGPVTEQTSQTRHTDLRFVDGDPELHFGAKLLKTNLRIVVEQFNRGTVEPAVVRNERCGQIPVVQCHNRLDSICLQSIDQVVVVVDAILIDPALRAIWQNPRPRQGKSISIGTKLFQYAYVVFVLVETVTRDVGVLAFEESRSRVSEHVPDARPFAASVPRSFNLKGSRRGPPQKSVREITEQESIPHFVCRFVSTDAAAAA